MAPMTRSRSPGGVPGPDVAAYYARRAAGGIGLIITEGTWIDHPAAGNRTEVPRFYGEDALAGWAGVLHAVHEAGGKIMPQLWHIGMTRPPGTGFNPAAPSVGPSGLVFSEAGKPCVQASEPLSQSGIDKLVEAYASAAESAQRLGFDGIEIHAAHGYLVDQFLWSVTNRRSDAYGGDMSGRVRFATEIVRECRRRTGPGFPICFRFSQWKSGDYDAQVVTSPAELGQMVEPLVEAGVDLFHCSVRRYWEPGFPGSDLSLAGWTRKLSGKPVITVGSVGVDQIFIRATMEGEGYQAKAASLDRLLEMLEAGEFDLVAVGRALLANPDWAIKVRDGAFGELAPYTPQSRETFY